jgi:hypothetical protein
MRGALALAAALLAAAPAPAAAARRTARRVRPAPAAAPASAAAAAAPVRHGPEVGAVVYVTRARAYLDAGAADGVAAEQVLHLVRAGRQAGMCRVESVAPHFATCRAEGARPGDTFRLARPPAAPAPRPLPRLVAADELEARAAAIAAEPYARVDYDARRAAGAMSASRRAEVAVGHATWASTGFGPWHQESAEVSIRGAPLGAGFRLYADLSALRWTERPATARERPEARTQLYVWEAEVVAREGAGPLALAAGRVLPWGVPGATLLDGVQAGLRRAGTGEIGAFAGFVPEIGTMRPTGSRQTAGAYGSLDLGSGWLVTRQDARAAMVQSPELGTRFEGQLRSYALLGRRVNASGDLRVGTGGAIRAQGSLDGAELQLSGRPLPRLALSGAFRYGGLRVPDAPAPALFPGHERRADASAGLDLGGGLLLSATAGLSRDLSTDLERRYAGPELAVPRLFGAAGGLTLGYVEERGWIAGRNAYAQAVLRAGPRVRLTARLHYAADDRPGADADHEVGAFLAVSADLASWLSLRASVLARGGARRPTEVERSGGVDGAVELAGGY